MVNIKSFKNKTVVLFGGAKTKVEIRAGHNSIKFSHYNSKTYSDSGFSVPSVDVLYTKLDTDEKRDSFNVSANREIINTDSHQDRYLLISELPHITNVVARIYGGGGKSVNMMVNGDSLLRLDSNSKMFLLEVSSVGNHKLLK